MEMTKSIHFYIKFFQNYDLKKYGKNHFLVKKKKLLDSL